MYAEDLSPEQLATRLRKHLYEDVNRVFISIGRTLYTLKVQQKMLEGMCEEQDQVNPLSEMRTIIELEMSKLRPFVQAYESLTKTFVFIDELNKRAHHMGDPVEWSAAAKELNKWMDRQLSIFAEHDQAYWDAREVRYAMQAKRKRRE